MAIDLEKFNLVNQIVEAVHQGVFKSYEIEHLRTWDYYVLAEAEIRSIEKSKKSAKEFFREFKSKEK